MNNPEVAVSTKFFHTWFDDIENNTDVVYHVKLIKLNRKKLCTFVVSYRKHDEPEEESNDYEMTSIQLVTNF